MKRLFIIGNGFDIAHKLNTRYSDFRNYLLEQYPKAMDQDGRVPEPITRDQGEELFDDEEVVGFLIKIIDEASQLGDEWKDLEDALGKIDYGYLLDNWDEEDEEDEEDEGEQWDEVCDNEDNARNIKEIVIMIKNYFSEWINQIQISNSKPIKNFENLIDKSNDLFLTFNYTMTLEELYDAKNVIHIHGQQGDNLVFGHGNSQNHIEHYETEYTGSEDYISELHSELRKDTSKVIQQHKNYFKNLEILDSIYSYGFSFSEVDLVYIKEICQSTTEYTTWYLHEFDKAKCVEIQRKIRNNGYKGKFNFFS